MKTGSSWTKHRLVGRGGPLALAAALVASVGCGDATMTGENDGDGAGIVATTSALTPTDFTDGSGHVHIRVKTCDWTPSAVGYHCAYCVLDADWLRIGGGAEIENSPSSARLQASFPYPGASGPTGCTGNAGNGQDMTIWLARSKGTTAHRLRAYVVGLKVDGVTRTQIINGNYIRTHEDTAVVSSQPTKETPPQNNSLVVMGGGAELQAPFGTPINGYLTESRPLEPLDSNLGWRGAGVFDSGSQGGIKVFSIGLNPCLPGLASCLRWKWQTATAASGSGYRTATAATPYPWAMAGIGAWGVTNGTSSRYLADLIPFSGSTQGFTVRTKDEGTTVSGSTKGYALNLMDGSAGVWAFNSIRFNSAGTSFSRPSGTAPVTLQQSTGGQNDPERRWHLENMGSGQYRIRNGNPGTGTECACRISPSLNVRVTTCSTSSDCLWTTAGDAPGSGAFTLRNVANGRCIDNNAQGATTSDLVFRTCATGYSTTQSVFLDAFSWPP